MIQGEPILSLSGQAHKTDIRDSVSCRLPQTPRTPSVGMAHYFDDIFHRHVNIGTPRSPSMPRMRRSSTNRSISARSDFDAADVNGDEEEDEDEVRPRGPSRSASIYDPERIREKAAADEHLQHYISDQVEKVKTDRSAADGFQPGDEIEATAS